MYQGSTHILRPHKFCFAFVSEKRESKLSEFKNDIHEVLLKNFSVFSLLLEEQLKKYCCLTHKRCNWTKKFDVTKYLGLNTKNCNIKNYIFLNTLVDSFV